MNFKRFGLGKQLINPSIATYGKYIDVNGVEQTSASGLANHTDYIPVIANYAYTVSYDKPNVSGNTIAVSWYDSNKNFITRDSELMPFELGRYKFTKTAPNNAAFAIVNFTYFSAYTETQNTNNYIFAIGESQLPYEPYGNTWTDIPYYIHNTSTDTITTLPADVYADGQSATVGLVGNMSQTGTPTPTTPIQPQETGERTENLFGETLVSGYHLDITTGLPTTFGNNSRCAILSPIDVSNLNTVIFSFKSLTSSSKYFMYSLFNGTTLVERVAGKVSWNSIDVSSATHLYISVYSQIASEDILMSISDIMLNSGSTAPPYEPYGYKIPISSANTTTPVYLGEVETTRKIKKYEFTGSETWNVGSENFYCFVPETSGDGVPYSSVICSHCSGSTINNTGKAVFVKKSEFPNITTGAELKQYCLEQYANGTPVTVWYVLATPETAVVNEPLRKIGDYADTVSGITIPTITGADSFDVLTTLKPSEVSLSYTGWHDATVKEWDGSQWQ